MPSTKNIYSSEEYKQKELNFYKVQDFKSLTFSFHRKRVKMIRKYRKHYIPLGGFVMKIMSNELLVAAYRDAEKKGQDREWIKLLKSEITKRGLNPYKN